MSAKMADKTSMLSLADPVHLVVVRTESGGDAQLVSSHYLEWRTVLVGDGSRGVTQSVELMGTGIG